MDNLWLITLLLAAGCLLLAACYSYAPFPNEQCG